MTTTLQGAFREAAKLSEADQNDIGCQVLSHVQKIQKLRQDIDAGIASLDRGLGREFDMYDVIDEAHRRHGTR